MVTGLCFANYTVKGLKVSNGMDNIIGVMGDLCKMHFCTLPSLPAEEGGVGGYGGECGGGGGGVGGGGGGGQGVSRVVVCCLADMKATIIEQTKYNDELYRKLREEYLINKLYTYNKGLNKEK